MRPLHFRSLAGRPASGLLSFFVTLLVAPSPSAGFGPWPVSGAPWKRSGRFPFLAALLSRASVRDGQCGLLVFARLKSYLWVPTRIASGLQLPYSLFGPSKQKPTV